MQSVRRGAAAIMVVVVLVIINLVVVSMVLTGARGQEMTVRRLEAVEAFYAAEAGMNMAFRELIVDVDQDGDCSVGSISHDGDTGSDPTLGNARVVVTTSPLSATQVAVSSYGRSGNARRNMTAVMDLSAGSISFDAASSDWGNSNSLNFNHTIGGESNRLLVVCVGSESGGYDVSSVTYDSQPLTKAVDHEVGGSTTMNVEIWYMLEANLPAAGTYSVDISTTGSYWLVGGAISVYGAKQLPPEATSFGDDGEAGDTTITTDITTLTNGAWIFECVGSGDAHTGFSAQSGQNEQFDEVTSSSRVAGSYEQVDTSGLESQQWDLLSSSIRLSHVLAAFAPE